jgi:integrase
LLPVLSRFGSLASDAVDETVVQEFAADMKRTTFAIRKPNGGLVKTYKLSRKTIVNIVGTVNLVLGKKVWMTWELDLGKPVDPQQRYFTEEQVKRIIEAARGQYRTLFALLAGTGMRIGEASGLHVDDLDLDNGVMHVRRGVWNGQEQAQRPRTLSGRLTLTPALPTS